MELRTSNLIERPAFKTERYLDFGECTKFIEQKYNVIVKDYARSNEDFGRWCEQVEEQRTPCPPRCTEEILETHLKQFRRYKEDIRSGNFKERPYQNWWHWLGHVGVHQGALFELNAEMGDGAEPWQIEIMNLYLKEFGNGPYLAEW